MSQNITPLKMSVIRDPKICVMTEREFGIFKGSNDITFKRFPTTSFSPTSITLSTPPPSPNVITDRVIYLELPMEIEFTGSPANTQNVIDLAGGLDAFRAMPISQLLQNINLTINGQTISQNTSVYLPYLMNYMMDNKLPQGYYSGSPAMPDTYNTYRADVVNHTGNSPFNDYKNSVYYQCPRNAADITVVSNSPTAAVIQVTLYEPIILSPLLFGGENASGLVGVSQMDWNLTFYNQIQRIWSHSIAVAPAVNQILSATIKFGYGGLVPAFHFKYLTLSDIDSIPPAVTYDYNKMYYYVTESNSDLASGASSQIYSLTVQPNAIPRRLYIFVRERDGAKYNNPGPLLNSTTYGVTRPDTAAFITNISVIWNNRSGILSSASAWDLYRISVDNGCSLNWNQWKNQVGSFVCLEFGKDIPLNSALEAPGLQG